MGARTREREDALRRRIDDVLAAFLAERRAELAALRPEAVSLVEAIERLIATGGRRMRPALVVQGHLAGGGSDGDPIVRAAGSYELLHTMALIHDDVLDDADERRGAPAAHRAAAAAVGGDPELAAAAGRAFAVVCGDLAAVLADRMLLSSGFPADRVLGALELSLRVRTAMAAGQRVDPTEAAADPEGTAVLKGGAYSVEGPLLFGAVLAGAPEDGEVAAALRAFGRPLGAAFQLADDLRDGDAQPGVGPELVARLRGVALHALAGSGLPPGVTDVLRRIAEEVTSP